MAGVEQRLHRIAAFDGLSLAGKSTMVGMLSERASSAEVIRENTFDPHRPATSDLNKKLKVNELKKAFELVQEEFPDSRVVLARAFDYSQNYSPDARRQAMLAYMFTAGRSIVDNHLQEVIEHKDVILDRWQVTGWAYQADPTGYTWHDARKLNEDFGITMPDIQIILTCPIDQIPQRREYRDKEGAGTAGQMSRGREQIILPAFLEIAEFLAQEGVPVVTIENEGVPFPDLTAQIQQATLTYSLVEDFLRERGFNLKDKLKTPKSYWTNPDRLERIRERQVK